MRTIHACESVIGLATSCRPISAHIFNLAPYLATCEAQRPATVRFEHPVRMEGRAILAQCANGEKYHLEFQRRLADFCWHVVTENHGHGDPCRACRRPS